ncbi:MAG: SdpI family protein [Candidatus Diapherotrites archaeon]
MHKYEKMAIILVALMFLGAFIVYPMLPEKVPIHWNIKGEANGYGDPLVGAFMFPLIGIFMILLFWFIPKIAVFKENLKKFENEYYLFELFMILFFIVMFKLTLLPNFGFEFNMSWAIMPLIAILFIFIGIIMPKFKRNFFMGIRTPWTIANDVVWEKTHKLGGKLFIALGVISLIGLILPDLFLYIFVAPVLLVVAILFVYSYLEFKKINGGHVQL